MTRRLVTSVGVFLVVAGAFFNGGCKPDPSEACIETYRHASTLARRAADPTLMERFVDACRESFDPERLACIREAKTAGAALACKPVRKRPG